uniref:Uncharacterized protein n=1 Tax=Rhizophora mucronata TaxID=61149 RepID=A0A2P2Q8Q6_RHIMU
MKEFKKLPVKISCCIGIIINLFQLNVFLFIKTMRALWLLVKI